MDATRGARAIPGPLQGVDAVLERFFRLAGSRARRLGAADGTGELRARLIACGAGMSTRGLASGEAAEAVSALDALPPAAGERLRPPAAEPLDRPR